MRAAVLESAAFTDARMCLENGVGRGEGNVVVHDGAATGQTVRDRDRDRDGLLDLKASPVVACRHGTTLPVHPVRYTRCTRAARLVTCYTSSS